MSPHEKQCRVCQYGPDRIEWGVSNSEVARIVGCDRKSVSRHKDWAKAQGIETATTDPNWRPRSKWQSGENTLQSWTYVGEQGEPAWPVIQRAPEPPAKRKVTAAPLIKKWKTCVAGADTQIGFRVLPDGTQDPFHDDAALTLFNTLVEAENPHSVILAGDIIDMAEQGRFAQEASFANTTQLAIDRTYYWLADIRDKTGGEIHLIEGNHDKRLQRFVEENAKAAFGLRIAGMPESWPVMSLQNLLQTDALGIQYYDAYPNANVWLNNNLRAEHGTKVNSRGSTAQRYLDETPHVSRIIGHTHRQEIVQRTTWDRVGKIKSAVINPGCLCRVDGAVPSVHGSIGASGVPATVYEDWQQGAAIIRYTDDQFFVELVQFEDGMMLYKGQEVTA
jgi:predicted phosphodiesterase